MFEGHHGTGRGTKIPPSNSMSTAPAEAHNKSKQIRFLFELICRHDVTISYVRVSGTDSSDPEWTYRRTSKHGEEPYSPRYE